MVDGLSDRGSTPLRSIRKRPQSFALGPFSYGPEGSLGFSRVEVLAFGRGSTTSSGRWFWTDRSEAETDSPKGVLYA